MAGILERLGISTRTPKSATYNIGRSPWQEGSLQQILWADLIGAEVDTLPLSRGEAMTVPAVAKNRNLLVATVSGLKLEAFDSRGLLKTQPAWLTRTNSDVTPEERLVWTVDDGFFYGLSLWLTDRGEPDRSGRRPIINAEYCPYDSWSTEGGKILVNDRPVDESEIILFNFWTNGILDEGYRTIRQGRDLEVSVAGRVRNPSPIIDLHLIDDNLTQAEAEDYVKSWGIARRNPDGAVALTPPSIELKVHGDLKTELFENARNAIRTDVGSFANTRASMLDGTAGIDSLTYSTTQGERNAYFDIDLPFWTRPITARLSKEDIVPRGQEIRFNNPWETAPATPDTVRTPQ